MFKALAKKDLKASGPGLTPRDEEGTVIVLFPKKNSGKEGSIRAACRAVKGIRRTLDR
jgi:hypothetical protein